MTGDTDVSPEKLAGLGQCLYCIADHDWFYADCMVIVFHSASWSFGIVAGSTSDTAATASASLRGHRFWLTGRVAFFGDRSE